MSDKLSESFEFLIAEYQHLLKKQKEEFITKSELKTLNRLKIYLGKYL